MGITTRDLTPEDAGALAALMLRIEGDHPTGFCLSEVEVSEIMRDKPDAVFEGAFDGVDLVAYTTVMPGLPLDRGQQFTLFGDVDPQRTGEGLGTLMFQVTGAAVAVSPSGALIEAIVAECTIWKPSG